MVLLHENTGGARTRGGRARRNPDDSRKSAAGISLLDAKYSRLDSFAAALVGAPYSCMVLRREWARKRGARNTEQLRDVRFEKPEAGSRCTGHVVQLGFVAIFDVRLARKDGGLRTLLPDKRAHYRL